MKKLAIFLCCTVIAFVSLFTFTGCEKKNVIKVNEVTHSIFYAPFYVAINNGYFEDEGYKIELTNGGGSNVSMTALISKNADIILAGPETVVYVVNDGKENAPVVFGQLTKRDGSFLIGRTPEPNFEWSDLEGKEVIGGRRGGMPAMTLQYIMENNGGLTLGENGTNLNLDVAFDMTVGAFEGGQGDYVTMFEPTASEYVKAGKGYRIASVGEASGEVPYTAFIAMQSFLDKQGDKAEKFLRAVMKGYEYVMTASLDDVAKALQPSFTTTSIESIKDSIESYKSIDAWNATPVMSESAYNNLITIMMNAGELDNFVDFNKVVNNSIANKIANA